MELAKELRGNILEDIAIFIEDEAFEGSRKSDAPKELLREIARQEDREVVRFLLKLAEEARQGTNIKRTKNFLLMKLRGKTAFFEKKREIRWLLNRLETETIPIVSAVGAPSGISFTENRHPKTR